MCVCVCVWQCNIFFYFAEQVFWENKVEVHQSAKAKRNEFLQDLCEEDQEYENWFNHLNGDSRNAKHEIVSSVNVKTHKSSTKDYYLDKVVNTWSDFKKVHYHPRSTVTLPNLQDSDSFDSWISGVNNFKNDDAFGHVEEAVRFYAEECDNMQGFQMLCDINNGFGGFSSLLMEYLHDEFLGKSFAVFPTLHIDSDRTLSKAKNTFLSSILSLSSLIEYSSILCPLSLSSDLFSQESRLFPHLLYDAGSRYHTSAILSSSLENASRCYRLKCGGTSLLNLTKSLVSGSRNLVTMSAALPLPFNLEKHPTLFDLLIDHKATEPWFPITPNVDSSSGPELCFSQALSVSGVTADRICPVTSESSSPYNFKSPVELLEKYLSEKNPTSKNLVSVHTKPVSTSTSFPHIFSHYVMENGFLNLQKQISHLLPNSGGGEPSFLLKSPRKTSQKVKAVAINVRSVPVITNFQSSTCIKNLLKRCQNQATALKRWVAQDRHCDAQLERESLEEADERFHTLEQDYSFLTIHSSDSDSD